MILVGTSHKIRINTTVAAPLHVVFDYADLAAGVVDPAPLGFTVTATGITDLLTGAASGSRRVKTVSVFNTDAAITYVGVLQFYNGATARLVQAIQLAPGEVMRMGEDGHWSHADAQGRPKVQGFAGAPGVDGARFEHLQASALSVWTVAHNLGFKPNVQVTTIGGVGVLDPERLDLTNNTLTLTFDVAFAGYAFCI